MASSNKIKAGFGSTREPGRESTFKVYPPVREINLKLLRKEKIFT
jgi:hypothetical protein